MSPEELRWLSKAFRIALVRCNGTAAKSAVTGS